MKTSPAGLSFISEQEGFSASVYRDIAGIETIGYGHVMRHGDPTNVTREQAMAILGHDVASAESAVNADVKVALSQGQFDALVSFTFNLGSGSLSTSTLLQILNAGDTVNAAREFLRWCHARVNGQMVRVQGLYNRRVAEAVMFLGTPEDEAMRTLGIDVDPDATIRPVSASEVTPVAPEMEQPTPPGDDPDAA
jgi:lysozyme